MAETENTPETEEQGLQGAEAPKKTEEGAGEEEVKGKVEAPVEEKTYKQADIDKLTQELVKEKGRYGGLDKRLTEVTKSGKDDVSRLEEALAQQQLRTEEARDLTYLRKVEEEGGDVDRAKVLIARENTARETERKQAVTAREQKEQGEILTKAGMAYKATNLIKEHELDADVVDELLASKTPEEMEVKALKLRLEKGAADAKPIVETDAQDKGGKVDLSTLSNEEKLGLGMEGKL